MTVSTTTAKVSYTGNGSTTGFAVPFVFFGTDELEVIERTIATGAEVVKALTTHYTVSGGNGATGTVTAVTAPASTVEWHIRRKTARTQLVDYQANDPFSADTHERALDRAAARDQEIEETVGRALVFPKTDSASISPVLPSSVTRASMALGFDADGNPVALATQPGSLSLPVSVAQGGTGATGVDAALKVLINDATTRAPSLADKMGLYSSTGLTGGAALLALLLGLLMQAPCGRLTLTSGTPVQTATVSGGTSVLFTPYNGDRCPVYNGTSWAVTTFTEQTLALNNPAHAANTLYDVFKAEDPGSAGSFIIGTGPAWSSSTAGSSSRGTGAGTTELSRLNGIRVAANAITLRNGSTTYSISAQRATYLGTILTGGSAGQIDFSLGGVAANGTAARISLLTGNPACRRRYDGLIGDSTDTWSYATGTIRPANNSTTMRCTFIASGEDGARAMYTTAYVPDLTRTAYAGVGYDSTTAFSGWRIPNTGTSTTLAAAAGGHSLVPAEGLHYLQALENGPGAGTITWHGDNGGSNEQAGLEYEVWA